jgi:hypothetical protein
MPDETRVERLKRLQGDLARVCAETADLRSEAVNQSNARNRRDSPIKPDRPDDRSKRLKNGAGKF